MPKLLTSKRFLSQGYSPSLAVGSSLPRCIRSIAIAVPSLLAGLMVSWAGKVSAQTPASPPPSSLTEAIAHLDTAASKEDARAVLRLYSANFTNSDGLTRDTLEDALKAFWERYSNLNYSTVVNSWQQDGDAIVAETTTTITGTQDLNGRTLTLNATIGSRQRYENGKIVQQDILSEQSQVTAGDRPPAVAVQLPEQVSIGEAFNFDVIVEEPLGDRLLLGAALEEPINADGYLTTAPINLELLNSGGLFKVGRAPALPDNRWISGIVIREDGIVQVTRRLNVVSE